MHDRRQELEASLTLSPTPFLLFLALPALLCAVAAFSLPHPDAALLFAVGLYGALPIFWLFNSRRPQQAPLATVGAYLATIAIGALVVADTRAWLLGCAVTVLAAALGGKRLAIPTGALLTVAFVALGLAHLLAWPLAALGLVLNAMLLATVLALLRPVHTLAYWSFERYDRAQALLDEARDRQAELKQAVEALAHANRELALAHDRVSALRLVAEDARRTKASFVSNVSHEFRAPLNIIIGLAEILLDARKVYGSDLPPEAREDIAILYRNCQHLHDLVNDVLDLSQIEAGQLALHREWVDLGAILQAATTIVSPLVAAKGLALELDIAQDLHVFCDPRRIRQVVLNLVSNAARFTEQGRIAVSARLDGDQVLVSVADTGPGIQLDDVARIFEPFQQSATGGAVLGKGSGLGLAISREFVHLHEGRIWVETAPGQGSTFFFRLPIQPAAELPTSAQRWITPAWYDHVRTTRVATAVLGDRVIIHDETARMADILGRYAGELELVEAPVWGNIPAMCAETSARAVLLCSQDEGALLGQVQALAQQLQGTPIIGMATAPARAADELGGALDYITKPISAESLQGVLRRLDRAPQRLLIVDDEEDSRHVLRAQFERLVPAIAIQEARSGREALAMLAQWQPDLLLLDVIMPEMSGWQTLAALKAQPALAPVPVVMVSAQDRYAQPLTGSLLLASIQGGMNLSKLLAAFRALNDVLLPHSGAPAATPREKSNGSPAWQAQPWRQD